MVYGSGSARWRMIAREGRWKGRRRQKGVETCVVDTDVRKGRGRHVMAIYGVLFAAILLIMTLFIQQFVK